MKTPTSRLWHSNCHKKSTREGDTRKEPVNPWEVDYKRERGVELENQEEADKVEGGGDGAGDAPRGGRQQLSHEDVGEGGQAERVAQEGGDDGDQGKPGKRVRNDVSQLKVDC